MYRNFKKYAEVDFDKYWGRIKSTVHDYITSGNVKEETLIESKNDVTTLCTTVPDNYNERLYVETESFLTNYVKQLVENLEQKSGLVCLKLYHEASTQYRQGMNNLDVLYESLNVIYECGENEGLEFIVANCYDGLENRTLIGELGLEIWKDNMRTFEETLISNVLPTLLAESSSIIAEERWSDLSLLYFLVKSVKGEISPIIEQFDEYMNHRREMLLNISAPGPEGPKSPDEFVNRIVDFHAKHIKLIEQVFDGDSNFITPLDKTCHFVINHNPNSKTHCPAIDLLLKYCGGVLKKSSKQVSESDIEDKLSKAIIIFNYIDEQDIFEKLYKESLARRLLRRQSQSLEFEAAMITRLTHACGSDFTTALNQMIKDMTLSVDFTNQFQTNLINGNFQLGIDFSIHVLRAGNTWPYTSGTRIPVLAVPQVLTPYIQMFENFYKGQFTDRKLIWMHHLSQVQLTFKSYSITMPTLQMAILLLFENCDSLTCKDVRETLQLDFDQLWKYLASLVENKLLKSNTLTILPETILSLNLEFTNKNKKFKLSGPLKQDIPKEMKKAKGCVEKERRLHLNCLIARIMKARKTLRHADLIQEVLSQPKGLFTPNIISIKKSIENLIEMDLIERNPKCPYEYNYIP